MAEAVIFKRRLAVPLLISVFFLLLVSGFVVVSVYLDKVHSDIQRSFSQQQTNASEIAQLRVLLGGQDQLLRSAQVLPIPLLFERLTALDEKIYQLVNGLNEPTATLTQITKLQADIARHLKNLSHPQVQLADEDDIPARFSFELQQAVASSQNAIALLGQDFQRTDRLFAEAQSDIKRTLLITKGYVFAMSSLSVLVVYLVARALNTYLSTTAQSRRLALFPQLSPTPIISVNRKNHVTYTNPACERLFEKLQIDAKEIIVRLSEQLQDVQRQATAGDAPLKMFTITINEFVLRCEVHWLKEVKQWDLHLTDVTAQFLAEQKLQFQAFHHPQSGLANQNSFKQTLELCVAKRTPFTLGIAEIRSFNQLLRGTGFRRGPSAISAISALINKSCHDFREPVDVFHIGDKSFALLVHRTTSLTCIAELVENINKVLESTQIVEGYKPTLDFGFACFPDDADSVDTLIHFARMTLDESASKEHSSFMMFNPQLEEKNFREQTLKKALQQSIGEQSFEVYYQPQTCLDTGQIIGAEALLRWQFDGEWVSPAEFIPIAERSGLIVPLGGWVLDQACRQAAAWLNHKPDFVVAVNISPLQFANPYFLDKVFSALNDSGLPAQNLELEITEGVLFEHGEDSIRRLHELKQMGVQLAIDDFGTGYSSLSYLKSLPIDKLKIDQSFVRHINKSKADQSITRAIIELARNLELTIIAEGAEVGEQVEWLRQAGCIFVQGHWFSYPLTASDCEKMLRSRKD